MRTEGTGFLFKKNISIGNAHRQISHVDLYGFQAEKSDPVTFLISLTYVTPMVTPLLFMQKRNQGIQKHLLLSYQDISPPHANK